MNELYLSILERLETIRTEKGLNKTQFEKVLGKSTGYMNTLKKNKSIPGSEVLIRISDNYPEYSLNWILKGEGSMLKDSPEEKPEQVSEPGAAYSNLLQEVHADLKKDLHEMAAGMEKNFEVVSDGVFEGLKGQQKLLLFINDLDSKKIARASEGLEEFLKTRK